MGEPDRSPMAPNACTTDIYSPSQDVARHMSRQGSIAKGATENGIYTVTSTEQLTTTHAKIASLFGVCDSFAIWLRNHYKHHTPTGWTDKPRDRYPHVSASQPRPHVYSVSKPELSMRERRAIVLPSYATNAVGVEGAYGSQREREGGI
jgi:hypothetical protein